jgi:polyhydroxyalkanoate synthesis regulator phasin
MNKNATFLKEIIDELNAEVTTNSQSIKAEIDLLEQQLLEIETTDLPELEIAVHA